MVRNTSGAWAKYLFPGEGTIFLGPARTHGCFTGYGDQSELPHVSHAPELL